MCVFKHRLFEGDRPVKKFYAPLKTGNDNKKLTFRIGIRFQKMCRYYYHNYLTDFYLHYKETIICINIFLSIYVCKCKSWALHTKSRYSDILSGDQHWVPVKDMETCHGLCSPRLGFCFPIVCSARVKAYFKKGDGKTPTDCKESEVWPSLRNKSSVKAGGGSSQRLLRA